ncbi:hypothetical protein [Paraburkholderia saeva]|uniref:C2H2-type domain-containing protein n=1 Tax=Paraburkholderia saeva TaxID=2777537 RepID=A0A9N8RX56_9BURK|nr:hypothetical protein [Paraburkholderia saeva]CAG4900573.1 hypothetical protein LMG31841_02893 [Paraburkholderia saeva]
MNTIPNVISRTSKSVDWLFDRELEAADNASEAEYDRRERIVGSIRTAEVLDEMAESMTVAQEEAFMEALNRGGNKDVHTLYCLIDQFKEAIVKRRLAEPAPRFSMTYCSQCGKALGPGNSGVSHCYSHGA